MMRLPRPLFSVVLVGSFAVFAAAACARADWLHAIGIAKTPAEDQPATLKPVPEGTSDTSPAAHTAPTNTPARHPARANKPKLKDSVEDFWHYGKIARYDLAKRAAEQILVAKARPQQVLQDFEHVAQERGDDLDQWMIRWQGVKTLEKPVDRLMNLINEGRRQRRANPTFIEQNIQRLDRPGRPYRIAVTQLRESGELAVPMMIDYLRNPDKSQYDNGIRRALVDIGRPELNPLLAATEMKDQQTLVKIINVIGEIGYNVSVPYLARLANGVDQPEAVRMAALQALQQMGISDPRSIKPAAAFYALSEKFYYNNADISADTRDPRAKANIWYWNETNGLERKQVPPQIFSDIMAMRTSEYALKLGADRGDALSLWLAANYKREVDLPHGMGDPTRLPNQPSAHFYGVDAGAQYLDNALMRTLHDHDWPVALRVVRSLEQIIGNSTLKGHVNALVQAMASPDRPVRFEAAFSVAAAVPVKPFTGQERVVPLLAEALGQTGTLSIVVVLPSQDRVNRVIEQLKKQRIDVVGATNADAAVAAAQQLPSVDALVVSEHLGAVQVDRLLALAAQNQKLAGAAKVVITMTAASPYAIRAATDPTLTVTQDASAKGIKLAAEKARARSSTPINAKAAKIYALRAARLIRLLAISRSVLDLSPAQDATLAALRDARPEVVEAAGNALGWLDADDAQASLLSVAAAPKTTDNVKISLYHSLATNAKNFGNHLTADQVAQLDKIVATMTNNRVKSAAAEARGALNLPPDQAKTLILEQSRV